jgi:glucose dehydrogenase
MGLANVTAYAQIAAVDGATRADWPHYGGSQFSWRYSALDQINTANVKNLVPAWIFQTGDSAKGLRQRQSWWTG